MNIVHVDLNALNPAQTIWLVVAAISALTLAWMTFRLVMIGLKWTCLAGMVFLMASPFVQPLDTTIIAAEKMQAQLPAIQAQATELFRDLGNKTQKVAIYAFNEMTRPEVSKGQAPH